MKNAATCPLSYIVRETERVISGGYGCRITGARCDPCEHCDDWIKESKELRGSKAIDAPKSKSHNETDKAK